MTIPAGVVTVLVSALPQTTLPAIPSSIMISVTPSVDLMWEATGQRLATMLTVSTSPGWIVLPAVDQAGFITPDTRTAMTDWTYLVTVDWSETDGSQHTESGSIQCFSSQQVEYLTGQTGVLEPVETYPIGGIALNGWVATYADLPTGLTAADAGRTYMCQADERMYVWSGIAWPLDGQGFAATGPVGPTGNTGPAGPANSLSVGTVQTGDPLAITITGTAPSQTINFTLPEGHWWTGTGAPGTISGALNGDLYLDNSGTGNVYQLQSGTWVSQGTLLGPTGPTGPTGATGQRGSDWFTGSGAPGTVAGAISGDFYLDTASGTYYSYNGTSWASQGSLLGPTGPTGASSTWHDGSGVPASGLGANGDMYLNTANGDVYGPKASGAWGSAVANITGPAAPAATTTTEGIIQLAGDLAGTASAPTVPGLTSKAPLASPTFTGTLTTPALKVTTGAVGGDVLTSDASGNATWAAAPVTSVAGHTGAVTLAESDITGLTTDLAAKAPLASPTFTGTPAAPTASAGTATTQLATTAFVAAATPAASTSVAGLTAYGTTSTTACVGNDSRLSDTRTPTAGTSPYDLSIVAFAATTTRATGTGDFPFGVKLQRAVTFTSATFRVDTADASGNLVVQINKNGTLVSGTSTTIAAANQVAGGTSTGSWSFAVGDVLTVDITGVGTTPGKGLILDLTGTA